MKRLLSICLIICLLLAMVPAVSVAETKYGVVQGGWLRLRAAASFEAETLSSYYTGTVVTVLGTSGSWYKVQTPDGRTGYMYSAYLSIGTSSSSPSSGTSARVWSSNGYGVRLRSGPGTGYRVQAVYPVGTPLTVLERGSYWSRIQIGGQVGYMMNQFITGGGTPAPTPSGTGNAVIWSWNGYGVRLRTGPGKNHSIIGVYSVGTKVTILERGAVWDLIMVGSRVGYMMNEFLHYYPNTEVTNVTLNNMNPVVGDVLSALTITPAGAEVKYSWLVNGAEKGTAATYTVASGDKDKTIQLKVTGTGIYTGSATSAVTAKVITPTTITGVTINFAAGESPVVGDVLKVETITPAGATVSYEWYAGTRKVSTAATYTVASGDVGSKIHLRVEGTGAYSYYAESEKTGDVVPTAPVSSVDIYVGDTLLGGGKPNVGDVLTATLTPKNATVTYQWYSSGDGSTYTSISGATAATFSVTSAYARHYFKVIVNGKGNYTGTNITSVATGETTDLTRVTGVTIGGAGTGDLIYDADSNDPVTLTANYTPTTIASNHVTYQWLSDGIAVPGSTTISYDIRSDDIGAVISVKVVGDNVNAVGEATSTATSKVKGRVTGISFSTVGSDITLVTTPAEAADEVTIKWYASSNAGTNWTLLSYAGKTLSIQDGATVDMIKVEVTSGGNYVCNGTFVESVHSVKPLALEGDGEIDPDNSDVELLPDPGTDTDPEDDPDGVITFENPPEGNLSEGADTESGLAEDGSGDIITTVTDEETGAQGTIITPGVIDETTDTGASTDDQQVVVSPNQEESSPETQTPPLEGGWGSNEPIYGVIWINQSNGKLTVGGLNGAENVTYSWAGYKGKASSNASYKLSGSEPAGTRISVTVVVPNGTMAGTYIASYDVKGTEVSKTIVETDKGTGTIYTPSSPDAGLEDGAGIAGTPNNFWPIW